MGLQRATNLGVYNAKYDKILIVNDDNVFPKDWDEKLLEVWQEDAVIAPNQIEPIPSMFRQFDIKNLGRDPLKFDLEAFNNIRRRHKHRQGRRIWVNTTNLHV